MNRARLAVCALILLLPIGVRILGGWRALDLERLEARNPPASLAGLNAVADERWQADILKEIDPDDYILRLYKQGSLGAWVYVAFYGGYGSTGAHDPALCYPSQGWVISDLDRSVVPLSNSNDLLTTTIFRANQSARNELVMHWFQPATRWPGNPLAEPLWRIADSLFGAKHYAFVRVSLILPVHEPESAQAQETLTAIASELAPWVRETLNQRSELVREETAHARSDGGSHSERQPGPQLRQ